MEASERIWAAWSSGVRLTDLPAELRPADEHAGMAIQRGLAELAGPVFGWKIAATTELAQSYLGVDAPLAGMLFERFRHREGEPVPADTTALGVAEPEFAFRMRADPGSAPTMGEVLDAVDTLLLALELPDSRFTEHRGAGRPRLLADLALAGRFVEGPAVPEWRSADLAAHPVVLHSDGAEFSRGSGGAVLGDPRIALHWLATELGRHGFRLRPGDIVTTGTAAAPAPIEPGRHVLADFGAFGSVAARFTDVP